METGPLANHHSTHPDLKDRVTPADGVITGYGKVEGRLVCVAAYDFTVLAGSMGTTGEYKVTQIREMAVRQRMPIVWLLDLSGARIQETTGSQFAGSGHVFKEQVLMSGVIPQDSRRDGAVRGGYGVYSGSGRLCADGQRDGQYGVGRAASGQGSYGRRCRCGGVGR